MRTIRHVAQARAAPAALLASPCHPRPSPAGGQRTRFVTACSACTSGRASTAPTAVRIQAPPPPSCAACWTTEHGRRHAKDTHHAARHWARHSAAKSAAIVTQGTRARAVPPFCTGNQTGADVRPDGRCFYVLLYYVIIFLSRASPARRAVATRRQLTLRLRHRECPRCCSSEKIRAWSANRKPYGCEPECVRYATAETAAGTWTHSPWLRDKALVTEARLRDLQPCTTLKHGPRSWLRQGRCPRTCFCTC